MSASDKCYFLGWLQTASKQKIRRETKSDGILIGPIKNERRKKSKIKRENGKIENMIRNKEIESKRG